MKEVLSIDNPHFKKFCEKLSATIDNPDFEEFCEKLSAAIDNPHFEEFCEKLSAAIEGLKLKKCSEHRIPRGHFETDSEGNQWYEVDISPFEKSQLVRTTLEEMGDIDIEGTLKFFNTIDHFFDCQYCKEILDLIGPMDANA